MGDSGGLWGLAAVGLALVAAQGSLGSADAAPVATVLTQQIGLQVTMTRVQVASVPADEGFWINSDHGRMWVQIATIRESPYDVDEGDIVSLSGEVVGHNQDFPAQVGVTSGEGSADLVTAGAHISIALNALAFNSTA